MINEFRSSILRPLAAPVALLITLCMAAGAQAADATTTAPTFSPNWNSLRQYRCPEWFQDGKFGIYAHWGVYSAARGSKNTDWYGRNMYKPGDPNYEEQIKKHGPLTQFGYKDFVPLFTAENLTPKNGLTYTSRRVLNSPGRSANMPTVFPCGRPR